MSVRNTCVIDAHMVGAVLAGPCTSLEVFVDGPHSGNRVLRVGFAGSGFLPFIVRVFPRQCARETLTRGEGVGAPSSGQGELCRPLSQMMLS